jgi:hypothetical protein
MEAIDQQAAENDKAKTDSPPEKPAAADATPQPAAESQSTQPKPGADKSANEGSANPDASGKAEDPDDAPPPPSKEDDDSALAIGPAQDSINVASSSAPDAPPICNITLLLTSGGRHPYRIDAKYLKRRNVAMPDVTGHGHPDPLSISIYTLKELILREWRTDWDSKPASPSSIRLIHFGKLLDDKEQLKSKYFSTWRTSQDIDTDRLG